MKISVIVAASTNNVIGAKGSLPWRLPEDLKRFRALTTGKPIVMGRLTHESIGRPLPDRQNIVLSSDANFSAPGCDVATTTDAAIQLAGATDEVMIIGGGHVYRQFLPQTERVYMTRVHASIDGDTFFPQLESGEWQLVSCEDHAAGSSSEYPFSFELFERR